MKKIKKLLISPTFTIVALLLASGLLIFSTIGGARAALIYYSESYHSQLETKDIGVTLIENDAEIAFRDYAKDKSDGTWNEKEGVLLVQMLGQEQDGKVVPGKQYPEVLCVKNSGTIDNYVRVTIYKYWIDAQGEKVRQIDPHAINLHLVNLVGDENGQQCWIEDETARTDERTVLYYHNLLAANDGEESEVSSITPAFSDTICIDVDLEQYTKVDRTEDGIIITTSKLDGYQFVVEVTVDAVQNHNAREAILSAWGKSVIIQDNTLSLW